MKISLSEKCGTGRRPGGCGLRACDFTLQAVTTRHEILCLQREEVIGRGLPFTKKLNLSVTAPKEFVGIFGSLPLIICTDWWCHYLRVTVLLQPVRTPFLRVRKILPTSQENWNNLLLKHSTGGRQRKHFWARLPTDRRWLTDSLTDRHTDSDWVRMSNGEMKTKLLQASLLPPYLERPSVGNYLLGQFAGNCSLWLWPRPKSDRSVPFWRDGLRWLRQIALEIDTIRGININLLVCCSLCRGREELCQ